MRQTRWAVLGTADIAARWFLPAMRAAGGEAVVVGSRDPGRARAWADVNGVGRVADYDGVLADEDVDAIYIALPNHEHTRWAAKAVTTGRAVVCEKPLGIDSIDTHQLLNATPDDALLWEAFFFPFHPQTALLQTQITELGGVREIVSDFHFPAHFENNIRWQRSAGGGALLDLGCYCIRLARLLYDAEPVTAVARAFTAHGVDAEIAAILDFPDERRLLLSAGMRSTLSTYTRIIGRTAELRVPSPFHPRRSDTVSRWANGKQVAEWSAGDRRAFQYGIEHVHTVLRGDEAPRHLARTDAPGNARAVDLVAEAAQCKARALQSP